MTRSSATSIALPLRSAKSAGAIFQLFRDGHPHTKSELAKQLGMARSTISQKIDALVAAGFLQPMGRNPSSGGRPAALIAQNTDAHSVVGVDLGATHGQVAVFDVAGRVRADIRTSLDMSDGPEAVLSWVVSAAQECLHRAGGLVRPLGVGIGLTGPVDLETGMPVKPPIMPGWDGFDVRGYISTRMDAPVHVDNDVNVLAIGERASHWPDVDDLVYVKVSTGIGTGIVSGGVLQRGAHGSAGDFGHVYVPALDSMQRDPKDGRDLEAIAGGLAIARVISEAGPAAATTADVVRLLRLGETAAIDAVRNAGREVGSALATAVNLLNPALIVVGGSLGNEGEHLLAGIREVVYARSTPLATQRLQIVQSQSGTLGGAMGAAFLTIDRELSVERIDAHFADQAAPADAATG